MLMPSDFHKYIYILATCTAVNQATRRTPKKHHSQGYSNLGTYRSNSLEIDYDATGARAISLWISMQPLQKQKFAPAERK